MDWHFSLLQAMFRGNFTNKLLGQLNETLFERHFRQQLFLDTVDTRLLADSRISRDPEVEAQKLVKSL